MARERRTFWVYVSDSRSVQQAEGWACAHDYWWFPTLGWSIPAARCHASYEAARLEALDDLRAERVKIEAALSRAEARASCPCGSGLPEGQCEGEYEGARNEF